MFDILGSLDRRRFLGFPIWEFSLRSVPRLYGRMFMRDIALRHPVRTVQALLAYRHFYRHDHREETIINVGVERASNGQEETPPGQSGGLLVALGFCQKPLGPPSVGCPAGRFSHECTVMTRSDLLAADDGQLPRPCNDCDIRLVGAAALRAGATVYIMTSAADIARHLFIPMLEAERFGHGLFLLCPYSIPAMILPLLICRLPSSLVGYDEGDCRDYAEFILADEGTKDKRTWLQEDKHEAVLGYLQKVASAYQATGQRPTRFRREGALYVPSG